MIFAFLPTRTLQTRITLQQCLSVTPLFATLTDQSQADENTTTLSPAFATLTRHITPNSFICHSYKKHPGGGVPCPAANAQYSQPLPRFSTSSKHPGHAQTPATPFLFKRLRTLSVTMGGR